MTFISRPEFYTKEISYIYRYAKIQKKTQTAAVDPGIRIRNNQVLGYFL